MAATMQCISVQTLTFHPMVNFVHPKTHRSALWHCPIHTIAIRELENVTKVMNQKTVKILFRHLHFLLSSARLAPLREHCLAQNTHEHQ